MPASGTTHTFAKRGLALEPPLIAGIAVVALLFNVIIAVSFCLLRNRRKLTTHKRRVPASVDCEKYETSVAFAVTAGAMPATFPTKAARGSERKTYFELIQTLQRQPGVPSPTRLSRGSSHSSTDSARRLSTYVLRPQDIKELDGVPRYPKTKGRVQVLRQSAIVVPPGRATLTRSSSFAETASVYSSASAPLEYHEQLFRTQPFALGPQLPASAPPWLSELPKAPAPAVIFDGLEGDDVAPTKLPQSSQESMSTLRIPDISRRPSHPDVPVSPSILPSSSSSTISPTHYRARANSSFHASPPRVEWLPLQVPAWQGVTSPKKTNSEASLATMYSLHEATRVIPVRPIPTIPVRPLNIKRRSEDLQAQAGDGQNEPATAATLPASEAARVVPSVPARSSRRPATSGSMARLP
ncbi:hypothetical protein PYCCODRAFT_1431091 [Trametes coccinea BRFM310]|uniref:Uncharacterized protein n=1 Tax=Trametes coccinea (strain BRFM310) TaxID=1353009 RepID=A0A1Y2J0H2_TRAC3|nr:hypothetical protein PYCCODRAFT_1431091 [Trametes coccinea BRFM310]